MNRTRCENTRICPNFRLRADLRLLFFLKFPQRSPEQYAPSPRRHPARLVRRRLVDDLLLATGHRDPQVGIHTQLGTLRFSCHFVTVDNCFRKINPISPCIRRQDLTTVIVTQPQSGASDGRQGATWTDYRRKVPPGRRSRRTLDRSLGDDARQALRRGFRPQNLHLSKWTGGLQVQARLCGRDHPESRDAASAGISELEHRIFAEADVPPELAGLQRRTDDRERPIPDRSTPRPLPTSRTVLLGDEIVGLLPVPAENVLFATVFKVYSTFSSRRFACDLRDAVAKGYLTKHMHYNAITAYLDKSELTPRLHRLIQLSSLPLAHVEVDFAADATGFSSSRFARWFDESRGIERIWLMIGCKVNIMCVACRQTSRFSRQCKWNGESQTNLLS